MIPGNTSSQGKYADPPTSIVATAGNAQASIAFTLPVYDGKGDATYVVTASPGGATASGSSSPIVVTGLTNGTAYTFTVTTLTGYGVTAVSGSSNSATPVAPGPPPPPPPPPCSCTTPGPNGPPCAFVGYTCDPSVPTLSYEYYDCGCSQTCPGTGGYNQAYRDGVCGYVAPAPPPALPGCSCCVGTTAFEAECYGPGLSNYRYRYGVSYDGSCGASGGSGTGCSGACTGCSCPAFTDWGAWQYPGYGC